MTREDWKNRRETKDAVGVNALRETINDYENKMCELHTENLNLQHDNKQLVKTINELKNDLDKQKKETNRNWEWYKTADKKLSAMKDEQKYLKENSETKWFQRRARKKIIEKLAHHIRYGY